MSGRSNLAASIAFNVLLAGAATAIGQSLPARSMPQTGTQSPTTLRIGLWTLWHDKQVSITPNPRAAFRLCESCVPSALVRPIQIRASANEVVLPSNRSAGSVWLSGQLVLSAHGESRTLNNPLRISALNGELVLVVTLPVESYVERVVASESGTADSQESLKALAIVVRSFALHQRHGHSGYDLCDSTHCQLLHWLGNPGERVGSSAAHAATLSTAGETLWYHGERAEAWFHQNCGGRTASPREVWPGKSPSSVPEPWLRSRADPYCTANGAREWSARLSKAEITAALDAAGLARPGWNALTVARRGESGRVVTLLVDSTPVSAEDFRMAVGRSLGWGHILSTWFEVSREGDQFVFHGRGSGHGVGLCQAGAAAMSVQGHNAREIIAQYFPGTEAMDEATGQSWRSFPDYGFVLETLDPADARFLPELSRALNEAENRSGIRASQPITVRAFRSTSAFRDATLAPGWVAAFTEGGWIATQPLAKLAARKMLYATLSHEFLHALIEGHAAPTTPLWLREGLVEALEDRTIPTGHAPALKLEEVDFALSHASTEAESQAAHRAAEWYAWRLLVRHGREQTLEWLRFGLPPSALAGIR